MQFALRLRHQLMLVSLLILCLPWAGCQFVRETESAMLQGQERVLLASARAVSLRLADDDSLELSNKSTRAEENPLYFHALNEAPDVDGFDEDWRNFPIVPSLMVAEGSELEAIDASSDHHLPEVYGGVYRGLSYLFLRIPNENARYLDPSQDPLFSGDYLRIVRANQPDLYLGASAPGNINARYVDQGQIRPEYSLSGVWNHTGTAYQIELRMRPRLLEGTLGIEFVDMADASDPTIYQLGLVDAQPLPYVATNMEIAEALNVFAGEGLRLAMLDANGWLLASAGAFEAPNYNHANRYGLLTRMYQMILRNKESQLLPQWQSWGRLDSEDVKQALGGEVSAAQFRLGDRKVGRGSVPIVRNGKVVGAVVVEQTTDSLTTTTNHAFNRLLFWSFISMFVVGFGLIFYASLLSYRIRSLSKAAEMAMDENGKIQNQFPVSTFNDEVGDLSRSFDQLLSRLHEYTEYLRTLSGKLSHELKTPLAVVRSSLDNLEQQNLSEEARVYTDRASDGAGRLSAIFAALSSATRLEESIRGAELEKINLVDMITAVHSAYVGAYPAANIQLSIAPDLDTVEVHIAPELIVQMLDKLVDNAVDFCTKGGAITLAVTADSSWACIDVTNDGPLLPEEMQTQLFDSLVSVRSSSSEAPHLGLGMYIARLIVEFHEGAISASNRDDNSGVVVSVRLPLSP